MAFAQKLVIKYIRTKFKVLSSLSKTKAAKKAFQLFCTPQHRNLKKLPPIFEKAEKLQFSFEKCTVKGYRWNKGAEKKVLILHGFESSVVNFDRYIKPLIKKDFEVLAFDAPAHGRSTGKTINVITYKNLIDYIFNYFGPINSFMAHSFGGLALSLFLENIPHDENIKVVLIAPAVETKTAADHFFRFLQLDNGVRKEFDQLIENMSGQNPQWFSIKRAAENIKAQVLFFQDVSDEMTPYADVVPIKDLQLPNFHFVITEGLGHRRIYRDNKVTKAVIDFL
jgi:esterase/lipase